MIVKDLITELQSLDATLPVYMRIMGAVAGFSAGLATEVKAEVVTNGPEADDTEVAVVIGVQ